jgi:hypothetical protein
MKVMIQLYKNKVFLFNYFISFYYWDFLFNRFTTYIKSRSSSSWTNIKCIITTITSRSIITRTFKTTYFTLFTTLTIFSIALSFYIPVCTFLFLSVNNIYIYIFSSLCVVCIQETRPKNAHFLCVYVHIFLCF